MPGLHCDITESATYRPQHQAAASELLDLMGLALGNPCRLHVAAGQQFSGTSASSSGSALPNACSMSTVLGAEHSPALSGRKRRRGRLPKRATGPGGLGRLGKGAAAVDQPSELARLPVPGADQEHKVKQPAARA
jgi:hypothetical protein